MNVGEIHAYIFLYFNIFIYGNKVTNRHPGLPVLAYGLTNKKKIIHLPLILYLLYSKIKMEVTGLYTFIVIVIILNDFLFLFDSFRLII